MVEVRLPAGGLVELRRGIEESVDDAVRVLRESGRKLARDVESNIIDRAGVPLPTLSLSRFWFEVSDYFEEMGWGRVEHEEMSGGIGSLRAEGWAESDPSESRGDPGCHLTTGLFAELLSQAAGQAVAVMEIECRSQGSGACRFLFGSPTSLLRVHRRLAEEDSLEDALAAI